VAVVSEAVEVLAAADPVGPGKYHKSNEVVNE